MFILLIGFITPAIIFAIFGIIACLRRSSFVTIDVDDDKEYEILDSDIPIRVEVPKPYHTYFGLSFPPIGYQNFFPAPTVGMPPSYSEATSIPLLLTPQDRRSRRKSSGGSQSSGASTSKSEPRHLPRNAPKIRPVIPPPHVAVQIEHCPIAF
ncbi:hypothetical protein PMAYCL1PPCAC_31123 [Pristionchus mayeri]|uniref:Uncharacterized protein n=1 Tax=Pristionchus mayeri TaxID=1317129 RepID=A0AAN5ICB9_9BILA|nr:hypothetical protein PMAYCL1PPCAC_31123 [Pristionchus mayeri]